MKYIKKYEADWNTDYSNKYVKIKSNDKEYSDDYNEFLNYNIGIVVDSENYYIYVEFIKNLKSKHLYNFNRIHTFRKDNIKYSASTLGELKLKISAGKYNI